MIKVCKDCIYNNDGFCDKTYRDDLDEVIDCDKKVKEFELSFYYDEPSGEYRVIAFYPNDGEILKQTEIPSKQIIQMLKREKDSKLQHIISQIKNM